MTNKLLVGHADKTEQLLHINGGFLLLAEPDLCAAAQHKFPRAHVFDPLAHSFNPLKDMDYRGARDFAALLYGISPEGGNTLTVRNGRRALTRLLLSNKPRLDKLLPIPLTEMHEGTLEALATINDLLLSPVLTNVLCKPTNFSFKPTRKIIAKLDRAKLGDFDALVLGTLLIGQFQGQVIVPDAFYLREFHTSLIRQNRLIAGLNSFAEVSKTLEQTLLGIKDKLIFRTTPQDAEKLIIYTRHVEPNILVRQTGAEYTPAE